MVQRVVLLIGASWPLPVGTAAVPEHLAALAGGLGRRWGGEVDSGGLHGLERALQAMRDDVKGNGLGPD